MCNLFFGTHLHFKWKTSSLSLRWLKYFEVNKYTEEIHNVVNKNAQVFDTLAKNYKYFQGMGNECFKETIHELE